ncbi:uncharacterized protein LOC133714275 [Rosa rugosa]|uniref:uncharacterized protein LOC133714275 n=1 Tax=Rosa rugosa TaxID=74645 RepID=UPI002B406F6A|nr:uncharacterized protein LOC133714275 [Rosa rugosa]
MAEEFSKAVDDGLRLSKRLYLGKDRAVAPPRPPPVMDKSASSAAAGCAYIPTSPMVYAVISDPRIVDNPDIPSYQPHVHGRCDPPALIPLPMNRVELEVDCFMDTAFIRVTGSWRVHCVKSSRSCGCRIAIPMGEQGSILGVEVDISGKSFYTQLSQLKDDTDMSKVPQGEGGFLNVKPHIFTLTTPPVDGGVNLTIKMRWSQKLLYRNGEFSLDIPFTFPEFVIPPGKKYLKKEKIELNVNSGLGTEILFKGTSHLLKEGQSQEGKLGFKYEGNVVNWSSTDFHFSYAVSSSQIHGTVITQSPSKDDVDQREIFSAYLLPGNQQSGKGFRRNVVVVVDISGSMQGKPLEDTQNALSEALSKLDPEDSFCIIAFNGQTYVSSTSLKSATKEAVESAIEWIGINFIAGGDTNIMRPLNMAIEMLSNSRGSLPIIFLVTDGAVEDERQICDEIKKRLASEDAISPRIYTFGIGSFCNHYFLRMLSTIGRGQYDAAYDIDLVQPRIQNLFATASSVILTNITLETLDDLDDVEVLPCHIPDLSFESPLSVSGRFRGKLPETFKVKGFSADMSNIVINLKVQDAKDIPLHRVCAKGEIELLTAQAWHSENKQLEDKVAKLSVHTGALSEYTRMVIFEKEVALQQMASKKSQNKKEDTETLKMILPHSLCVGFGNVAATSDNIPPGAEEPKLPEAVEIFAKAASGCCGRMCNHCCCMNCIRCCSHINPQCANLLTQIFTGLACVGCISCCAEVCCGRRGS